MIAIVWLIFFFLWPMVSARPDSRSVTASTVYTLRRYVASFKSSKVNKVLVLRLLLFAMKQQANLIKEPGP